MWNEKQKKAFIKKHHWYQSFDYPEFSVKGDSHSRKKWKAFKLPKRLDGLSLLDIGANAGFFCFEAQRRGANRTIGIETVQQYQKVALDLNRNIFNYVVNCTFIHKDVMTMAPGNFAADIVLCLAAGHYIFDQVQLLALLSSFTKQVLLLEIPYTEAKQKCVTVVKRSTGQEVYYPSLVFLQDRLGSYFDTVEDLGEIERLDKQARKLFKCHKEKSSL